MKIIFAGTTRGHNIGRMENANKFFYIDTKEPYNGSDTDKRPCIKCNKSPTKEGHDACLGTLKDVKYACCGHGNEDEDMDTAYIYFENEKKIYGHKKVQKYLKGINKKNRKGK